MPDTPIRPDVGSVYPSLHTNPNDQRIAQCGSITKRYPIARAQIDGYTDPAEL
ncbi:MAG TPA: hypothetical protein V6D19_08480 [Stenomitos sp.]